MRVIELINELLDYNPNAEIATKHYETICLGYTAEGHNHKGEIIHFDKETTPIVWIDGCDEVEDD